MCVGRVVVRFYRLTPRYCRRVRGGFVFAPTFVGPQSKLGFGQGLADICKTNTTGGMVDNRCESFDGDSNRGRKRMQMRARPVQSVSQLIPLGFERLIRLRTVIQPRP